MDSRYGATFPLDFPVLDRERPELPADARRILEGAQERRRSVGLAYNKAFTRGVVYDGTVPTSWTQFLNFGDASQPFLKHEKFALNQDGSALFVPVVGLPGSPAEGTFVYTSDTHQFQFWNGSAWVGLSSGSVGVSQVTGTANQVTVSPITGNVVVSLPSSGTLPGSWTAQTNFTVGSVLLPGTFMRLYSGVSDGVTTKSDLRASSANNLILSAAAGGDLFLNFDHGNFVRVAGSGLRAEVDNSIDIGTTGANRFRSGYFGERVYVENNIDGIPVQLNHISNTGPNTAGIIGRRARVGPAAVAQDDVLAGLYGVGYHSGGAYGGNVAAIRFLAAEAFTATAQGSYIDFATNPTGSVGRSTRWIINAAGHFIGAVDNTYDIGLSGGNRPRTGNFGTSVVVGTDPGGSDSIRTGGSILSASVIKSQSGTAGSTDDEHLRFGKTGVPAAGNPYYVFKTSIAATPVGYLIGWDATTARQFFACDYGNTRFDLGSAQIPIIRAPSATSFIIGADPGGGDLVRVGGSARFSGNIGIGIGSAAITGLRLNGGILTGGTIQQGIRVDPTFGSDATSEGRVLFLGGVTPAVAFTMSSLQALRIVDASKGAGSTITTQYGILIDSQTQGGTNYALVSNLGFVQFGDHAAIGATPQTDRVFDLRLQPTGSATTKYGIVSRPVMPSSTTNTAIAVYGRVDTAVAAFTVGTIYTFFANEPTLGAGSAVTDLVGVGVNTSGLSVGGNKYGLWIGDQSGGAVASYAIYTNAGLVRLGGATTIASGDLTTSAGRLLITVNSASTAAIINQQGAGALLRLQLSGADKLVVDNSGNATLNAGWLAFGAAASKIIPGATSLSLRNNADSADNLLIADAGGITIRNSLTSSGNCSFAAGNTAKVLIDGTDGTLASGEMGVAENGGNLWVGARSTLFLLMDSNADAVGVVAFAKGTQAASTALLQLDQSGNLSWQNGDVLIQRVGVTKLTATTTLTTSSQDFAIGTLGTFDSADVPNDNDILFYHAGSTNKWQAESLQLIYNAGDSKVQLNAIDNTTTAFVYLDPGAGADSPVGAPPVPVVKIFPAHKAATVQVLASSAPDIEYHDGASFPADFRHFIIEYSTDNFATITRTLCTCTSDKAVHGRLTAGTTYYYRARAIDKAGNASANSTVVSFVATANSDSSAFGILLASEIAVDRLAALSANIGIVTAGQLRNSGNTAGVNLGGAGGIPGTWTSGINFEVGAGSGSMTRYINFTATGANPVFKHELLSLNADGSAVFSGKLTVAASASLGSTNVIYHSLNTDWTSTGLNQGTTATNFKVSASVLDSGVNNFQTVIPLRVDDGTIAEAVTNFYMLSIGGVTLSGTGSVSKVRGILIETSAVPGADSAALEALNGSLIAKAFEFNSSAGIIKPNSALAGSPDILIESKAGAQNLSIADDGTVKVWRNRLQVALGPNATQNTLDVSQEWTNSGTTFTAIKLNITDTFSAAASLLADLQIGGVSKFKITKAADITIVGTSTMIISPSASAIGNNSANDLNFFTSGTTRWQIKDATGDFQPGADASQNIGSAARRVQDLWLARGLGIGVAPLPTVGTITMSNDAGTHFIELTSDANAHIGTGSNHQFAIYTNGLARITIAAAGDVTIASSHLNVNGLVYTWPSIHGVGNRVLQNDGTGTLVWASAAGITNNISSASLDFTDGDTLKRFTIVDAAVSAASKIVCSIRRPDTADESADKGYIYSVNVVKVASGSFDVLVAVTDGFDDVTELPPNETVSLIYATT